jgi:hypothetical protein
MAPPRATRSQQAFFPIRVHLCSSVATSLRPLLVFPLLLAGCSSVPEKKAEVPEPAPKPKILLFYPSAAVAARGEQVLFCYGVENAASVRIEPPVEQITPSFNRCFEHEPKATGKYKLIAVGKDGSEVSQEFEVTVQGTAAGKKPTSAAGGRSGMIASFLSSSPSVPAGGEATLCWNAGKATSVRLEPSPGLVPSGPKACVTVKPAQTTTYTLTASGAGAEDTAKLTVQVR